jgi:hypothetical protein
MAEATAPKPSSSVKLVLLGEAAVGKVNGTLESSLILINICAVVARLTLCE